MPQQYDPTQFRLIVIHGWENQKHEPLIHNRIKRYLYTGNPEYLYNTRYAKIREGLLNK